MKKVVLLFSICCLCSLGVVAQVDSPDDQIFTKVEAEAQFPGGLKAFKTFLETNLNSGVPVDNRAPKGKYTVIVRFIVNKNGVVSDVMAETNWGYGMEDEVVRVIKLSAKWTPATQNGVVVNAFRRQPITFIVSKK